MSNLIDPLLDYYIYYLFICIVRLQVDSTYSATHIHHNEIKFACSLSLPLVTMVDLLGKIVRAHTELVDQEVREFHVGTWRQGDFGRHGSTSRFRIRCLYPFFVQQLFKSLFGVIQTELVRVVQVGAKINESRSSRRSFDEFLQDESDVGVLVPVKGCYKGLLGHFVRVHVDHGVVGLRFPSFFLDGDSDNLETAVLELDVGHSQAVFVRIGAHALALVAGGNLTPDFACSIFWNAMLRQEALVEHLLSAGQWFGHGWIDKGTVV
jgi:hypothetical protein